MAYGVDDGSLSWTNRSLKGVTVNHLGRSRGEGFFDGDPYALLVELPTGGDGVLPDSWDDLVRWLIEFGAIWQATKSVAEAAESMARLIQRAKRGWEARQAKPWGLFPVVLERVEWDYGALARYLNIPLDVSLDMLADLGYEQSSLDGLIFRRSTQPDANSLGDAISNHLVGQSVKDSKK
jgi:hypothetical protein